MKGLLMERAIFHQLKDGTQIHIFLYFLAHLPLVGIESCFLRGWIQTLWWTTRQELSTHKVVTMALPTVDGKILRICRRSTPEPVHREI
jgi:hypothetical protein